MEFTLLYRHQSIRRVKCAGKIFFVCVCDAAVDSVRALHSIPVSVVARCGVNVWEWLQQQRT